MKPRLKDGDEVECSICMKHGIEWLVKQDGKKMLTNWQKKGNNKMERRRKN